MNDKDIMDVPSIYKEIVSKSEEIGFTMPSDPQIGSLLKTLMASKPKSRFLELGTGASLSLSWMIEGMDKDSQLVTIDNDPELIALARTFFGDDKRLEIICGDGAEWLLNYDGPGFDLIFADAWPGKFSQLSETLNMLNPGGMYVIDDLLEQPNWPDNHQGNVDLLIADLESRRELTLTKLNWSTGILIATKQEHLT